MLKNVLKLNSKLWFCLIAILVQQVTLGVSTYFIGKAGASLSRSDPLITIRFIEYFFVFALLAYLLGMLSYYLKIKAQNYAIKKYSENVIEELRVSPQKNSNLNRDKFTSWMTGEATHTICDAIELVSEGTSIALNLAITFAVFNFTIGKAISGALFFALVVSLVLVLIFRKKVELLAQQNQSTYLEVGTHLRTLWDNTFYAPVDHAAKAKRDHFLKLGIYFEKNVSYTILEQTIASVPILVTVPLLIFFTETMYNVPTYTLGILVAILPRTLQLLGNVHAISIFQTQFVYIKSKYSGLARFVAELENVVFKDNIQIAKIKLKNSGANRSADATIENILAGKITTGRYTIRGQNGSGKTMLMKLLKDSNKQSLLLSPEVKLHQSDESNISTGELQKVNLNFALSSRSPMLLLDEWDANLDRSSVRKYDKLINKYSENFIVLEVRHGK
jgi:ABC-type bacteriocin/lantibiotic exporter with double-glycine peptidase domain